MVHRIQNRNTGYSDFSNTGPTASFNFSTNTTNQAFHGANALNLENEITSESMSQMTVKDDINQVNNQYHQELLKNQEAESIVENSSSEDEVSFTTEALQQNENSLTEQETENDLSEFGVESDAPVYLIMKRVI